MQRRREQLRRGNGPIAFVIAAGAPCSLGRVRIQMSPRLPSVVHAVALWFRTPDEKPRFSWFFAKGI